MNLILKLFVTAHLIAYINGYFLYPVPECTYCRASCTTVSGPLAPQGRILPGQLIFEDNFDRLNLQAWRHSLTLSGKGVSAYMAILLRSKLFTLILLGI